jgi:thiol-disulfide isomerase/thioredoxin
MHATDSQPDAPARSGFRGWILMAIVAAAALVYVVISTAPSRQPSGTQGAAIGRKLQFLHLQPLTGDAKTVFAEDLQGHVTLLNYWGTWCGPCIREFPHLVELAKAFADDDTFRFYPVSCGNQGDDADLSELRGATEDFLQARNTHLATYADQSAASRRRLALLFGMDQFSYPTTMLLDRDGRVRGFWVGYNPQYVDDMRSLITELLADGGTAPAS